MHIDFFFIKKMDSVTSGFKTNCSSLRVWSCNISLQAEYSSLVSLYSVNKGRVFMNEPFLFLFCSHSRSTVDQKCPIIPVWHQVCSLQNSSPLATGTGESEIDERQVEGDGGMSDRGNCVYSCTVHCWVWFQVWTCWCHVQQLIGSQRYAARVEACW